MPREVLGASTSSLQFFRNIGAAVGISTMGKTMSYILTHHTTQEMLNKAHLTAEQFHKIASHPEALVSPVARQTMDPKILSLLRESLYFSLQGVFFVAFLTTVLALIVSFSIPEVIPKKLGKE